ncbi:S8 family serine peptidase [Natronospira bacteriovora]|uniref:S8 family serine peptidase n=1 Tax=Natronospira bacteriovora TaxID=3069753 RepID=A0ABU0W8Q6_9GAMM|nr:S8 family serine peptidase [Natronospira sp. AB-CW4]MDQ2069375.1 S8 family serine peptidase [Natronospira sp. AB-CW4]
MRLKTLLIACAASLVLTSSVALANNDRMIDVIVSLNDGGPAAEHVNNRAEARNFAHGLGLQPRHVYGAALTGFSASVPEARLASLRNHPRVASVNIDTEMSIAQGNCPHCGGGGGGGGGGQTVPWGIDRVGSQDNPNTGAGINVYILDTGIDPRHDDLNVAGGYAIERCRGGRCAADWDDGHGHGTHVAGTVAALDNDIDVVGVAPDAILWAVKVLGDNGSGSRSGVIAGVDWVTQQAIELGEPVVGNMSLGGSGSKTGECTSNGFSGDDSYHEALCNAKHAGVVMVVAAGNSGADAAGAVPAAYDDAVITVSATNSNDDWTSWSNWGDRSASWTSNNSAPVAIAAPGASILSTSAGGGTETMSGTSMAAPHVAGGAALFLSSSNQSASSSAFYNTRSALLNQAEDTGSFSNTSGNPHDEDFLDASGL